MDRTAELMEIMARLRERFAPLVIVAEGRLTGGRIELDDRLAEALLHFGEELEQAKSRP